ncbi:MAG: selenocysteine-specific translation elongation factor [Gammaproteobacteria bacterium]|nr:selenocysteine-specific translation elongation factor [Gammaproteobacteria bacterium]MDH3534835.1 selenocysteine-specific translation elongation factor [Gammaproteobacteria bacterium]
MIIATAGHVDHGKTELIKALTGIDTDRLPEEKARGLSIDLGFAYQALPDNTTLGFVDVPGHEKFIRNMLAGVAGIDLGLLVVAADDGVMPQTREHFAILDLLGIKQCVVAITKIDRVDDDRILEVQDQVETLLGNAGHEEIAMYPVCAPDNEGVDALRNALHERAQDEDGRHIDGHFRMAIDRVFILKGVGLVVTGMVFAGAAIIDENLVVSSDGSQVRVRGIRAHNEVSNRARAGERCALNIVGRGVSEASVSRGNWLMHSSLYAPTRRIDVDLRVLGSESRPLKHWTPTHLHIGAGRLAARVAVLSGGSIAAGERGLAQLVLEQDAFVVHGDRFVLRDQSARRTIAGGHVIDPFSPRRGRARPTRIAALHAMNRRNPSHVLGALTELSEVGVPLTPFAVSHNLPDVRTDTIIDSLSLRRVGRHPHERVFNATRWQGFLDHIEMTVGAFHQSRPELPGSHIRDIQIALKPHVETPILEEAAGLLLNEKRLDRQGARFHLPSHVIQVSAHDRQLWSRAAVMLAPSSGSPPSLHQAAEALGVDKEILEASLKNAVKIGEMVLVAKNRYLPTSYLAQLGCAAEVLAKKTVDGYFTAAEYCDQTQTGRNFAIDLLEYFDRLGFTERIDNKRHIKRPASTVFVIEVVSS